MSAGLQQIVCDKAYKSSLEIPNPCIKFSELSSDDRENLLAQIDRLKDEIHVKFLKLQADLIKSLKGLITPKQLVQTLKAHMTYHGSAAIFDHHKEELIAAKDIEDIFIIMNPYFSFFNYDLIEVIITVHGACSDKENMQQYLRDFSEYCKKIPCVEFHEEYNANESRTKIKFKLDYDRNNDLELGDIKRIQRQIAEILHVDPCVVYLHSVEDGCILITFLVPTFFVNCLIDLIAKNKSDLMKNVKLLHYDVEQMHDVWPSESNKPKLKEGQHRVSTPGEDTSETQEPRDPGKKQ